MTTEGQTPSPLHFASFAGAAEAVLDRMFQFKPGDVVALRETVEALKAELEAFGPRDRYGSRSLGAPYGLVVSERLLAQCHGGVQGFYHILERDADRKGMVSRVPTHAVVPYAEMTAALKALAPPTKEKRGSWKDAVDNVAAMTDAAGLVAEIAGSSEK